MKADDRDRIDLILDMIEQIEGEVAGLSREAFLDRRMIRDLAAYRLGTIGEAAWQLSAETREQQPQVPWRAIYVFRNIVVHDYGAVEPERVWNIIRDNLSELKNACQQLRDTLDDRS